MRQPDQLSEFVRTALTAGQDRAQIRAALDSAGWTASEINGALRGWAEGAFTPPVPRPRPFVSAREVFLYGLMFIALTMVTINLAQLGMALVDLWMSRDLALEELDHYYSGNYLLPRIRWCIAVLVVFAPVFLFLNARAERIARADPGTRRSLVRKWFVSLALFASVVVILGDLSYTIYALLDGDLTWQFLVKAAIVGVIAGLVFLYFRDEMKEAADANG